MEKQEKQRAIDEGYMRMALELAQNAHGRTTPNPLVGAVIVKDGRVVAVGWHRKAGTPHAEVHALTMAGELARGATIYVTLEPCSHYGRTGPCAKAVIDAGIARVVMGMVDPNPKVAGKGLAMLEEAGVEVTVGVLEDECRALNDVFLTWMTQKRPFTVLKTAMSLDGKICDAQGESQWITSAAARARGHEWRDEVDAIMVGSGTALKDNPSLTTRLDGRPGRNPIRIIIDSGARLPLDAQVLTDGAARTIIVVTEQAPAERRAALAGRGAEIVVCGTGEHVDLALMMARLAEMRICSILVEGGGRLTYALLAAGLIDQVHAFIAPKIIGGAQALTPVEGAGFPLADAVALTRVTTEQVGPDILISGYVERAEVR